jgi:nicotinamidase-related amidase
VRDVLLLIDILSPFDHQDGERLAAAFREAAPALEAALEAARARDIPVVYVNDAAGHWDGDGQALIRRAEEGLAGGEVARVMPRDGEALLVKPRYSAFDLTALPYVLEQLGAERLLMAGTATEMCITQSAIDARELGYKVTVLADACASVDDRLADIALDYLQEVGGVFVERDSAGVVAGTAGRG